LDFVPTTTVYQRQMLLRRRCRFLCHLHPRCIGDVRADVAWRQ
jgi:hypothetical protein